VGAAATSASTSRVDIVASFPWVTDFADA
jgi:hypothetical protein